MKVRQAELFMRWGGPCFHEDEAGRVFIRVRRAVLSMKVRRAELFKRVRRDQLV